MLVTKIFSFSHSVLKVFLYMNVKSFPNKPWFLSVCSTSLLKTLWNKEKFLVMSNFSFSHSVFYPSGELSAIFINFSFSHSVFYPFGELSAIFINFSFSHSVFYPFGELSAVFINLKLPFANSFRLEE